MHGTGNGVSPKIFSSLELDESRRRAFGVSVVVHMLMLTVLFAIPLIFTETLKVRYQAVVVSPPPEPLLTEAIEWPQPPPRMNPVMAEPRPTPSDPAPPIPVPAATAPEPLPAPEPAKAELIPVPRIVEPEPIRPITPVVRTVELRTERPPSIAAPKLGVVTDVFAAETAARPANQPSREVQAGRFGAVDGTAPAPAARAAAPGAFGGGFSSARSEVAEPKDAGRDVRRGSFGDAEAAKPAAAAGRRETPPPDTPAQITFKPRPDYTEEARRLRLEGEVVLRVLFAASGEVRILELVRGLGHGLDETAVNAAQKIKFKPALRNGQAVDSTANVYIAFQLAF